jgi:hypothetical protein
MSVGDGASATQRMLNLPKGSLLGILCADAPGSLRYRIVLSTHPSTTYSATAKPPKALTFLTEACSMSSSTRPILTVCVCVSLSSSTRTLDIRVWGFQTTLPDSQAINMAVRPTGVLPSDKVPS